MQRDDSIFEPEVRDGPGELRELVHEVVEQDDPDDTQKNLAVSGGAMLVVAFLMGAVGLWLVRIGMTTTRAGMLGPDKRHPPTTGITSQCSSRRER
jgi:hypothetical protein